MEKWLSPLPHHAVMTAGEEVVNGINVPETKQYIEECERDPSKAERNPTITAKWVTGPQAAVELKGRKIHIGGDDDPSAMTVLLASLAACDVEVVATHAALLGLKLEGMEIEAKGHFNIRRLLGLEGPGPGYDRIAYTVRLRAPHATEEQIARVKAMCERASPVGDSLAKPIPLTLRVEVAKD